MKLWIACSSKWEDFNIHGVFDSKEAAWAAAREGVRRESLNPEYEHRPRVASCELNVLGNFDVAWEWDEEAA